MQDDRPATPAIRHELLRAEWLNAPSGLRCDVCLDPLAVSAVIGREGGHQIDLCPDCLKLAFGKLGLES